MSSYYLSVFIGLSRENEIIVKFHSTYIVVVSLLFCPGEQQKAQLSSSASAGATSSCGKTQIRDYSRLLSTILDALSSAPPALLASMLPNQLSKVRHFAGAAAAAMLRL